MVSVKIYVEGGGTTSALRSKCRAGFSQFIRKAGLSERMPRVVACGSRDEAFESFCTAYSLKKDDELPLLLVDAEGPVSEYKRPWQHLADRDKWNRPEGATDEHAHLMVQLMESWFLADQESLGKFYGKDFNKKAIPVRKQVEEIQKKDVISSLSNATRNSNKGSYSKGKHSFEILSEIDPKKVEEVAPYAARFLETLRRVSA
jgi:hypothetical protein